MSTTLRDKQENRKKDFKKGIDAEQARRKREEISSTIRKTARDDFLLKKRKEMLSTSNGALSSELVIPADIQQQFEEYEKKDLETKLQLLPDLTAALNSSDQAIVVSALIQFRKLLSIGKSSS
ncbi:hypothetical protein SAMD00019534_063080 [Acytostelium subglobosum LB1]|uniref:hypothetical protein n=1 Tax=Acytostelium subglobosum LB1 TaxID=1410327 RepID=UPI000644B81D|nr:hypothetical protein SAMD00019534_063080 [Acytostelium subglobosum LB1]GAM23133.1 hypothetical protein SAMD00019534_063080 [Acytostelium subglobosum LB1]|eukprot:XP_012753582.1 hypothetical protein SAMD00019534_063080 [Acytostelium subglobosum LB1]